MDKKQQPRGSRKKSTQGGGKIFRSIIIVFLALVLVGGVSVFFMLSTIVGSVDTDDLADKIVNKEPSTMYAADGTKFYEWGGVSRENVTYQQIPQSTIDAFLAIEDSRYFSHNGFDLPRFISSALFNVKSGSFAQGGSTLTMQTIDNFIMKPEEEKAEKEGKEYSALEKVERKVQEIYMSMSLEKDLSKEDIITKYLNEINFGDSARGIQKGAEYYFGKNVEDLSLAESAFLAGVINAPNSYNPYRGYDESTNDNFYQYASERRDETLSLMLKHGYITETEYKLAKNTKLAFQLTGEKKKSSSGNDKYYDYAYQTAKEVLALTGEDPALVPMKIYTSLDLNAQDQANEISSGNVVNLFSDSNFQIGFTVLNNQTGEIVAVSGGRSDVESKTYLTRYTEPKSVGSTIKPLLDYAPTFDKLGWTTSRVMEDKQLSIPGWSVQNSDGNFYGKVSLERAVSKSLNTIAVQSLQALLESEGQDALIQYLKDMGFDDEVADAFSLQYSIGGAEMKGSTTQMAAAYAALANGGYYIEPHMVTKVEYKDESRTFDNKPKKTRIMSEQAAYMMSDLLYKAVNGKTKGENLMGSLGFGAYPVYGKTGTSDWGDLGVKYGIPVLAMKDEWMVNYTSEYTIATWSGFDESKEGAYFTMDMINANIPGWINKSMLDTISSNAVRIQQPDGISSYGGGLIKTEWLSSAAKNNPMTEENANVTSSKLEAAISSAEGMNADDYTADSYAKLKEALANAKKVMENSAATQEQIDAARSALESAMQGLVKKEETPKTDSSALSSALNSAQGYVDTTKYQSDKVAALQSAISSGNSVLANKDSTQEQIDAAAAAINTAVQNCISSPVQTTPPDTGTGGETNNGSGTTPNPDTSQNGQNNQGNQTTTP